jgi:pimeloyl-ACP methyl ester carboxylesterase
MRLKEHNREENHVKEEAMLKGLTRWVKRTLWCVFAWSLFGFGESAQAEHRDAVGVTVNIVTIDHAVPHISTVPANAGELVHLFVRERVLEADGSRDKKPREAVLMIHSRSVPVLPAYELKTDHYDWALWLAQAGGFDVFMLDFQGSGRSPRPKMDDPCNVPTAQQSSLLIPNPLSATCQPSYPFQLNTIESDWDELDTVVDYIRKLRGVDKVHLISWSQGSWRIGPYAADHPEKVASLFFLAPIFNSGFTSTPPSIPQPGTPMGLTSRAAFFGLWRPELRCEDQREDSIEDRVWDAIMAEDDLGRTWGKPPAGAPAGSPPEGVMRVRNVVLWGWNNAVAALINVPVLIMQGEFDTGAGGRQDLEQLYDQVPHPNKLRFRAQCSGHFMQWEKQRRVLHHISKEWIQNGKVAGFDQGEFFVDTEGNLSPLVD